MRIKNWISRLALVLTMQIGFAAQAQESIFLPLSGDESEHADVPADDTLQSWIKLQSDLYKVVLTFDEKAKQLEKHLLLNEQARLHNEEIRFNAQSSHWKPDENGNYGGEQQIYGSMLCSELNESLDRYITKNIPALDDAIQKLTADSAGMNETQKAAFAGRIQVLLASVPNIRRSQEILYLCLYKYKTESGMSAPWSVEKTLRRWYMVQAPILDIWLGNVD